jgi:hypothetical protein
VSRLCRAGLHLWANGTTVGAVDLVLALSVGSNHVVCLDCGVRQRIYDRLMSVVRQ